VTYRVELSPAAQRDLAPLDENVRLRIRARLRELAEDPRPPGCKKLKDQEGRLRVRVGDWRILYSVRDSERVVEVGHILHRSKAYR
jgi:mRNA interferase RelE/StbE